MQGFLPAAAHALAIAAAFCGAAAWTVLALGLLYARFLVPKERAGGRPSVLSPRTASQVFVVLYVTVISGTGLLLALIALAIDYGARWAWIGAALSGGFLAAFGIAGLIYRYRHPLPRQRGHGAR